MKHDEALKWLEELDRGPKKPGDFGGPPKDRLRAKWLVEAQTAVESLFPESHPVRRNWNAYFRDKHPAEVASHDGIMDELEGVVSAARSIFEGNRLTTLVGAIRAETVEELLDQAAILVEAGHVGAAAVVAGGALETFLHFLCTKHNLEINGHGSISTYVQALAVSRKAGNEIIKAPDESQATAWGVLRNSAAHKPGEFHEPPDRVKLMIEGIRQFIARYGG